MPRPPVGGASVGTTSSRGEKGGGEDGWWDGGGVRGKEVGRERREEEEVHQELDRALARLHAGWGEGRRLTPGAHHHVTADGLDEPEGERESWGRGESTAVFPLQCFTK